MVEPTREALVSRVAHELLDLLVDATSEQDRVDIVLTGGTVGIDVLREVKELPRVGAVEWQKVRVWWGDERFVPENDPDRNDRQAKDALLDSLPLRQENIHAFPADHGQSLELALAEFKAGFNREFAGSPRLDVVLNGVGHDGHVASLFPGRDHGEPNEFVVSIDDSPKPPSQRLSMTFDALNSGAHVWLVAAGSDKAAAIAELMQGSSQPGAPASHLKGRISTTVFVDELAASELR